MPTLAPPAPPPLLRPAAPSAPAPSLIVSSLGRSLLDYAQGFALDVEAWRGRDVLDVGAGASSFVAEACARRINAVAVDPLYSQPPDSLATRIQSDSARRPSPAPARPMAVKVAVSGASTRVASSASPAEIDRRTPAERFLADYATHFIHNRYVAGALPRLPFFDGTFDLVLCAHVLCTSGDRFDFEGHVTALRELLRVSAGEARVHPLASAAGRAYPALPRLRRELRAHGIATEIVAVGPTGAGPDAMLVLRRADG